jgi:enoyl-CoA hydratase/carnithine racemase
MNIVGKNIVSLFRNTSFRMCETKVENKIGYIYMNSPKDFNALSFDMKKSLVQNVKQFEQSSDVKVIVLLSNFKKAFCAGGNIKEFQNKSSKDFENNDIFQ